MNGHALTCPAGYRDESPCECIHKFREMPVGEPRFCKDCRHCVGDDLSFAKCALAVDELSNEAEFLVSGVSLVPTLRYCATERAPYGECGSLGKRWEPKP